MTSGLYVVAGAPPSTPALPCSGGIWAQARGVLASSAQRGSLELLFEGILTGGRAADADDAQVALEAFERGGVEALRSLDGFYQLALIDTVRGSATIVCDAMATRPLYVYAGAGVAAIAPSPAWFAGLGLPMQLDRLGLYQVFRLNHGIGGRTLAREVTRSRPLTVYELSGDGSVRRWGLEPVRKRSDASMTLDAATDRLRDITAEVIAGIVSHPRLRARQIHLPLTAGMDSRHLLAELLRQDRAPALLRHVRLSDNELLPVAAIAADYKLPLQATDVANLDYSSLCRRWVETAGAVHFHQMYLMAVADAPVGSGVLGFDGYLADIFLGFYPFTTAIGNRYYSRVMLRRWFDDHRSLDAATNAEIDAELALFAGPESFCIGGAESFNRGLCYTGSVFPVLGDDALYFAPGAHRKALDFYCTVPEAVAGAKRARLHLFRRDFPALGAYPNEYGTSYLELDTLYNSKSVPWSKALAFARGMLTPRRHDPAPDTEHAWLRQIAPLHALSRRVSHDSALAADGHLPASRLARAWRLHQAGAFLAWPLMSSITADVGYRVLICRQPPDEVAGWLQS